MSLELGLVPAVHAQTALPFIFLTTAVKESCNMSWSRNAILVVLLIAALLNVVVGVSVPSTRVWILMVGPFLKLTQSYATAELGGWIYADTADTRRIMFVDALRIAQSRAKTNRYQSPLCQVFRSTLITLKLAVFLRTGFLLPTTTPPSLHRDEEPSDADVGNAWKRGVPGLVIFRFYPMTNERRSDKKPELIKW
ncbi:hypothetical protein BC829DRAFT_418877 [Chytridium lagenaria]|nr:hypothetical protein BC829DRAFT_418877 [Chytridium lagenaria]